MPHTSVPAARKAHAPPTYLAVLEPLRAVLDAMKNPRRSSQALPFVTRRPVIVYPGLATNAFATRLLRQSLTTLGHAVSDWEQGLNTGPSGKFDVWLEPLRRQVEQQAALHGQPVVLVGWSLGGIYARELAKLLPGQVSQVITLGTPFSNLQHTNVGGLFDLLNRARFPVPRGFSKRLREAPPVPTTSIYSRTDGVVAWRACRVPEGIASQNIEVNDASHLGLVAHPEVAYLIAHRLQHSAGEWMRY